MRKRIAILAIAVLLIGCKTQSVVLPQSRDSVSIQTRLDSIYIYERDSVFVDRYVKSDTVFLTRTIERVKYKDVFRLQHDTIMQTEMQTIVQTERYIPKFYKTCTWLFFGLVILILGRIVIRIYFKR